MVPLGLTATAAATNTAIQKKIFESSTTTLINSDDVMKDITKIVKSLEDSGFLIKGVSKRIKNNTKEQNTRLLACCWVHKTTVY